jgi:hypothetical protein
VLALGVLGCKAPSSTNAGAAPIPAAEVSAVVAQATPAASPSPAASASARDVPGPSVDAGSASASPAVDPTCKKHAFCDVLRLLARAARGDGQAKATVTAEIDGRDCDYLAGDVWAGRCVDDGCTLYLDGKVAEAELRKHVVRSGALPPKTPDLRSAPFDALPRIPLEARPMLAAVATCLSDFAADAMPDPFPVSITKESPYWMPALTAVGLWRFDGATRQKASLGWQIENTEVLEHSGEDGVTEPTSWQYFVTFEGLRALDGGRFDARSRDGGDGTSPKR